MTTTSHLQIRPDYFRCPEECKNFTKINTNKRYKYFCQTHFTAGDIEQFETYRDKTNGKNDMKINLEQNIWKNIENNDKINWEKYRNLSHESVDNTFRYLFNKFKKAIFVKIKDRKLSVFLPFSNKNFVNEWHIKIKSEGNMNIFLEKIQNLEGRKFYLKSVNKYIDTWFANNCLLRWEFPIKEGDTNIQCTSDFFHTLCSEREIPDIEFFVNRRDFPILTRNSTEAYDHIYGDNYKLVSHDYKEYSPILSMVNKENYADIAIPTSEDWARVMRKEGKYFPKTEDQDYKCYDIIWESKKNIAIFRGSCTGAGVTIETNPRLKLSYLSSLEKNKKYLDAGITEWNLRPRKLKNDNFLRSIDIDKLPFGLKPKMNQKEQQEYKYVVNIEGHVAAYRLSMELSCGFCILLVESDYKLWFYDQLKPNVHYISIKKDLSDLIDKIKWCQKNDDFCKKISENAKKFADNYLSKKGILDYTQKLLFDLKNITGNYIYPLDSNIEDMEKILEKNSYHRFSLSDFEKPKIEEKNFESIIFENKNTKIEEKNFESIIFENENTKITKYGSFCLKESKKKLINEAFVTLNGTNKLLNDIPNFIETIHFNKENNSIISKFISYQNLYQYIHSDNFNFFEFIQILYLVSLSIHVSQKKLKFIHWDLTPWNIMLKWEKADIQYIIDDKQIFQITTNVIPIIIDMDKSSIFFENKKYGGIKKNFSSIQDILSLLNTSIFEIANFDSDFNSVNNLIKLANFISNTDYRPKSFFRSGENGLGEIRFFFKRAKKFTDLIESDKFQLENLSPIDFVYFLEKNFKIHKFFNKKIKTCFDNIYHIPQDNYLKFFNFIFSHNKFITTFEDLSKFLIFNNIIDNFSEQKYHDKYKRCKKFIRNVIQNANIDDPYNLYDKFKVSFLRKN